MLLLEANHIVPLNRLIDAIWDTEPPSTARAQVHICISALRRLLAGLGKRDVIATQSPGYSLRVEPQQLDADLCRALVAQARSAAEHGANDECVMLMRSALDLYQGEVLAGVSSPLVEAKATRLKEEQLRIIEECLDLELQLGRHRELIGELSDTAAQHPLRERPQGMLMLALYRSGRQAEALEVYRETRRRLVRELGLEPGEELRNLEKAILTNDGDLLLEPADTVGSPVRRAESSQVAALSRTSRSDVLRALEELITDARIGLGSPQAAVVIAVIGGESEIGRTPLAERIREEKHAD